MKKTTLASVLVFVFLFTFGMVVTQARADSAKFKIISYITKMEAIPIGDVEGHLFLLYERRGVAVFEDGRNPAYHACGTAELTNGEGPAQGYVKYTFKDGSTTLSKYQAILKRPPGEKSAIMTGEGRYVKGTGTYEGIEGKLVFEGKYITPYGKETKGDMLINVTATYTLPSK